MSSNLYPCSLLVEDLIITTVGESGPEVDGVAGMAGEIFGADDAGFSDDLACQWRKNRDAWLVENHRRCSHLEFLKNWFNLCRVEREWDVQLGGFESLGRKQLRCSFDDTNSAAENGFLWTIHTCDLNHLSTKSFFDSVYATLDSKHAMGISGAFLFKELSATADK